MTPDRWHSVTRLDVPSSEIGESPIWAAEERALFWTDIAGRKLHRYEPETGTCDSWSASEAVGSMALADCNRFIAATESGFMTMDLPPDNGEAKFTPVVLPLHDRPDLRMNDGRCDRQGRFWAGSMAWRPSAGQAVGELYRLDEEGQACSILQNMIVSNGLAWSPDGRTMYHADTHASRRMVWQYDFDLDEGLPLNRRPFLYMADHAARPDGAAIDIEGCYWVAATDRGAVMRFSPAGRLDQLIELPVAHPTMPCFGGDDMRLLFVTSLWPDPARRANDDGSLFAVRVGAAGMPEPRYRAGARAA